MGQELDGNAIISKMSNKIANLSKDLSILEVQYDALRDAYEKQQELVDAYEEKENAAE